MKTLCTYISIVLLLLFFISAKSYCQLSIKGQIQEDEGNALPNANVILLASKDSSFAQGVVVKEGGEFQIDNVNPGNYDHDKNGYCHKPVLFGAEDYGSNRFYIYKG